MKVHKEESVLYRKKYEAKNWVTEIGNFSKIDKKTLKSASLILETTKNFSNPLSLDFWCLPAFLSLVLKVKENFFSRVSNGQSYRVIFIKKQFNFYHVTVPENINKFRWSSRNLMLFIENFILKGLQFKIHFKVTKKLSCNFMRIKNFLKRFFSIPTELGKVLSFFGNFKKKFSFNHFFNQMSLNCTVGSEIWIRIHLKTHDIPWWRFINVRECELEFFEQSSIFEYCSTFNRKNKYN